MLAKKNKRKLLKIRVIPNNSRNEIVGWQGDRLKIKISAPAEKGKANKELISFLSSQLKIRNKEIEIVNGFTSNNKIVFLPQSIIEYLESEKD